jgi:hypothetical protein
VIEALLNLVSLLNLHVGKIAEGSFRFVVEKEFHYSGQQLETDKAFHFD